MSTLEDAPGPSTALPEVEAALWRRWRAAGDRAARAGLIERHLPYARIVAATYYARRRDDDIEFGEYLQLASVALVESVDRYLPERGVQFRTFAARRMHGAIVDGLEQLTEKQQQIAAQRRLRDPRLQVAKEGGRRAADASPAGPQRLLAYLAEVGIGVALGILLEGTGMVEQDAAGAGAEPDAPYRQVELLRLRRRLAELVHRLPPPQRDVLQRHYLHDHSFVEIARHLQLSKGRVSQIHRQAVDALRRALGGRAVCDIAC